MPRWTLKCCTRDDKRSILALLLGGAVDPGAAELAASPTEGPGHVPNSAYWAPPITAPAVVFEGTGRGLINYRKMQGEIG